MCVNQLFLQFFQEYVEYADVKVYLIQILSRQVSGKKNPPLIFRKNVLKLLEILNFEGSISSETCLLLDKYDIPEDSVTKNVNSLWQDFFKFKVI
jgi:hypothetical protein